VKSRLATLLLAALFAALGLAAGPTTGLAIARPQAGIVWSIVHGGESRPAREQAREIAPAHASAPIASPVLIRAIAEFDPPSTALNRALFQRPPPFFLSNGR